MPARLLLVAHALVRAASPLLGTQGSPRARTCSHACGHGTLRTCATKLGLRQNPHLFPHPPEHLQRLSSSALVCVAVTIVRTRALPFATVGNPMPVASTPSAKSSRESSCATLASPTITGVMGVSLIPVLNPADIDR